MYVVKDLAVWHNAKTRLINSVRKRRLPRQDRNKKATTSPSTFFGARKWANMMTSRWVGHHQENKRKGNANTIKDGPYARVR